MIRKKKTGFIIIVAFIMIVWGIRFYTINDKKQPVITEIYGMKERVAVGNNYYIQSTEELDGYLFTVNNAQIKTLDEFLIEYNISKEDLSEFDTVPNYIYDLDLTIQNENNRIGGVNLINLRLLTMNDSFQVNTELFGILYPHLKGQIGFSLRENSEFKIHLPYTAISSWEKYYDLEEIKKKDFYLMLSAYPVKKVIRIK